MSTAVLVMVSIAAVMLAVAAALTVARMSRGPSSLDRVVAADVLIAVMIAGLALEAIVNDHSTTLPVMLVLSLLGFAGSVSIARFVADRDRAARRGALDLDREPPPDGGGPVGADEGGPVGADEGGAVSPTEEDG